MSYLFKTLIAAIIIVLVTEVSKRSTAMAAFLLALPIVSITSFLWIWMETKDKIKIADISQQTFWYVLPTLPMFLLLAWLLKNNISFYVSLGICCLITVVLFGLTQYLLIKQ